VAVITIDYMNKELIGITRNEDYNLYSSPFIINNKNGIIDIATRAYNKFKEVYKTSESTWTYDKYNIFTIMAGEPYSYIIFQQLVAAIRDRVGDGRPLWLQSWLNYHKEDEVLDWHWHDEDYIAHGYLSIEPKNTVTEFEKFTIENKVGNLYIGKTGPGYNHVVRVREPYEGIRITLVFDVKDSCTATKNLSFIPI